MADDACLSDVVGDGVRAAPDNSGDLRLGEAPGVEGNDAVGVTSSWPWPPHGSPRGRVRKFRRQPPPDRPDRDAVGGGDVRQGRAVGQLGEVGRRSQRHDSIFARGTDRALSQWTSAGARPSVWVRDQPAADASDPKAGLGVIDPCIEEDLLGNLEGRNDDYPISSPEGASSGSGGGNLCQFVVALSQPGDEASVPDPEPRADVRGGLHDRLMIRA